MRDELSNGRRAPCLGSTTRPRTPLKVVLKFTICGLGAAGGGNAASPHLRASAAPSSMQGACEFDS